MPIVGAAIRRAETARFARLLGALAGANVALPVALALAHSVLMNTVMADAVAAVAKQLKEGGGLADPLAGTGVFPDLAIQFIRIGEATGRLDEMLLKQADLFDGEVRRLIDRGLAMLVPAITILLGMIVAGIVASVHDRDPQRQ
jgi:general secretion pathway protein F